MAQTLDLGVGDVHVPGAASRSGENMAKLNAKQRRKRRLKAKAAAASAQRTAFRGTLKGLRMSVAHPDGTRMEVRHMAAYSDKEDSLILAIPLDKSAALSTGDENKRVWVQIARAGRWLGHRQGPFELNSQVFDSIVRNFKNQNVGRIQWDFEHASEQPATAGSIPVMGAPAQGWIYDLRHDGSNLYALTEWKDLARQYIENDQYGGVSPAIAWKSRDRSTGSDIGPVLTSVALTNKPFITGMRPPTAASTEGVTWLTAEGEELDETEVTLASGLCYSADEYMPRLKSIFRLPELASAQQCADALSNLRDHFALSGGNPSALRHGINLGEYMMPLRELTRCGMGATWEDVLDLVEDLIDAAIDEHEIEFHPDGPVAASAINEEESTTMATATTGTPAAATAAVTAAPQVSEPTAPAPTQATAAPQASQALDNSQAEIQTLSSTVSLQAAEIETLKRANAELLAWKTERETRDIESRVDAALATYRDKKGLTDDNRPTLITLCRNDSEGFDRMYPPVAPQNAHLLRDLTGAGGRSSTSEDGAPRVSADSATTSVEPPVMTLSQIAEHISTTEGISLEQAQLKADGLLNKARRRAAGK